jgi:hypothetical protein
MLEENSEDGDSMFFLIVRIYTQNISQINLRIENLKTSMNDSLAVFFYASPRRSFISSSKETV